jgi:NADH:ubiquinone oxidoreductase subunit D
METIITCIPDIGFLHTGIEKYRPKTYLKAEGDDNPRLLEHDGQQPGVCHGCGKLVELDVPPPRLSGSSDRIAAHRAILSGSAHRLDVGASMFCIVS